MGRRRKGSGKPLELASLLEQELRYFSAMPPLSVTLSRAWDAVVGKTIAAQARPIRLKGSLLIVRVRTSSWMNEVQYLTRNILSGLAKTWTEGTITELRFEVGELPPRILPTPPRPPRPPVNLNHRTLPPALVTALTGVQDPDLRQTIEWAVARTTARTDAGLPEAYQPPAANLPHREKLADPC